MRMIYVTHRYLALAVGLLMTLWCVSGFVMMYQSYPALTQNERLQGLAPLDLSACCNTAGLAQYAASSGGRFQIEMLNGDPVLRFGSARRSGQHTWNLRSGQPVQPLASGEVMDVAQTYGHRHAINGTPQSLGTIAVDQWTVQTARRNQPAYQIAFNDPAGTEIYVSGASGKVFQDTNRAERVLSWFGAIPHWLYPLELRENAALWAQVVIWTSVIGTVLVATGMIAGVARWQRARRHGRLSPFRGWWFWHHVTGLVFGVATLVWVFSGLMTMNPWGTLSGDGPNYGSELRGETSWNDTQNFLIALGHRTATDGVVQLRSVSFDNRLYALAIKADGERSLLDAQAQPTSLGVNDITTALAKLDQPVQQIELLTEEDSYYYDPETTAALPVYRVILRDGEATRLYIDPASASVRSVGSARRLSRWIRVGLHDFDFAWMRARPLWDLIVLPLLAGVTLLCATGTWMAWKRVRCDVRLLRRKLKRMSVSLADRPGTRSLLNQK